MAFPIAFMRRVSPPLDMTSPSYPPLSQILQAHLWDSSPPVMEATCIHMGMADKGLMQILGSTECKVCMGSMHMAMGSMHMAMGSMYMAVLGSKAPMFSPVCIQYMGSMVILDSKVLIRNLVLM